MKIAFSLLHYNNKNVTQEAVDYLQQLKDIDDCEIIIVDNASPNGSGIELEEQYKGKRNIHVLLNSKNGGFAYGNNVGYAYARNLGCDIIVVMNNDIFIKDKHFVNKLNNACRSVEADIIAPDIIGRNGHQNPFRLDRLSDARIKKMLRYNTLINVLYHFPLINQMLAYSLDMKDRKKVISENQENGNVNCIPHGACVIYLPSWTCKEEFAFLPQTFMYFEEDVLAEYMWAKGYTAVYYTDLFVYHVEDASVEYDNKTSVKKRLFISGCMKDSIKQVYEMRKEHKMRDQC